MSHGESFNACSTRRSIIPATSQDSPASTSPKPALSFSSTLRWLASLDRMRSRGTQVICATHSPVLAALPGDDPRARRLGHPRELVGRPGAGAVAARVPGVAGEVPAASVGVKTRLSALMDPRVRRSSSMRLAPRETSRPASVVGDAHVNARQPYAVASPSTATLPANSSNPAAAKARACAGDTTATTSAVTRRAASAISASVSPTTDHLTRRRCQAESDLEDRSVRSGADDSAASAAARIRTPRRDGSALPRRAARGRGGGGEHLGVKAIPSRVGGPVRLSGDYRRGVAGP